MSIHYRHSTPFKFDLMTEADVAKGHILIVKKKIALEKQRIRVGNRCGNNLELAEKELQRLLLI